MRPVLHTAPLLLVLTGCTQDGAPAEESLSAGEPGPSSLRQVADDEASYRDVVTHTTVTGTATVSPSPSLTGQLHYETVTDEGIALCDVARELTGRESNRCPDCEFAFDLTFESLWDRNRPDCSTDLKLSLTCDGLGLDLSSPGLGWTTGPDGSVSLICTDWVQEIYFGDGDALFRLPDTEAVFSDEGLSWVSRKESELWADVHYQPCGRVPSSQPARSSPDDPDFVARDTQTCQAGQETYDGGPYYNTRYAAPRPKYSDIFEFEATAGESLSVVVVPETLQTTFGGRLTLNGPDGCTVAHTRSLAKHCGANRCLSLETDIETTGTHQIVVATAGCPSGTASFEVQAQLD